MNGSGRRIARLIALLIGSYLLTVIMVEPVTRGGGWVGAGHVDPPPITYVLFAPSIVAGLAGLLALMDGDGMKDRGLLITGIIVTLLAGLEFFLVGMWIALANFS